MNLGKDLVERIRAGLKGMEGQLGREEGKSSQDALYICMKLPENQLHFKNNKYHLKKFNSFKENQNYV